MACSQPLLELEKFLLLAVQCCERMEDKYTEVDHVKGVWEYSILILEGFCITNSISSSLVRKNVEFSFCFEIEKYI